MWQALTIYAVVLIWTWPQGEARDIDELRKNWRIERWWMLAIAAPFLAFGVLTIGSFAWPAVTWASIYDGLKFFLALAIIFFTAKSIADFIVYLFRSGMRRKPPSVRHKTPPAV